MTGRPRDGCTVGLLDLYLDHAATTHLYHLVTNRLGLQILGAAIRSDETVPPVSLAASIRDEAARIGFDSRQFSRALCEHIKEEAAESRRPLAGENPRATPSGSTPSHKRTALEEMIHSRAVDIEAQIERVPNTPEKARAALLSFAISYDDTMDSDQTLEAMVLLRDQLPAHLVPRVIKEWREADQAHRRRRDERMIDTPVFWISRDFLEEIDGVSRYRFRDAFSVGELQPAFDAVEGMLATSLVEGIGGLDELLTRCEEMGLQWSGVLNAPTATDQPSTDAYER